MQKVREEEEQLPTFDRSAENTELLSQLVQFLLKENRSGKLDGDAA